MLRSLYTAATGMEAQQLKMDVIAHNLANTNTTGFKRNRAEFEDLLSETIRGAAPAGPNGGAPPAPLQVGLGVRTGSTTRSQSQGDILVTQNSLDVAIGGQGYFRIQRPSGDIAYTRGGNFQLDSTGRLCTQQGYIVDPGITVPRDATQITIHPDGTVSASVPGRDQPTDLGSLDLAMFANPNGLESIGDNLMVETVSSGQALVTKPGIDGAGVLTQGALEGANVKAVEEMIDMITTQRAYEMNSKVIQTADQMLQRLTSLR
jgi:flagellar basal-body rod protein FlgG